MKSVVVIPSRVYRRTLGKDWGKNIMKRIHRMLILEAQK